MVELSKAHQPEVLVAHANARLTPAGRMVLCQRIAAGRPVAHVAAEMGISRTCAYRWWGRYRQTGPAGLVDRPSCAHHHPRRTSAQLEAAVVALRQSRKLARLGSPRWSACRPRRSTGCCAATGSGDCSCWTGPVASSSAATSAPGQAS